jgi:hypothetical protein
MKIGFDFDGVLCPTPFGRLAVHAPGEVEDLPEAYEQLYGGKPPGGVLRLAVEYARFGWRRMAPDAPGVLRRLGGSHELHIVTGRSAAGRPLLRRWLRRHRLDDLVRGIHMAPPGLRPPQHKLAVAQMHGINAHIDDDPRTAYHLAKQGVPHVYLLDHAGALETDEDPLLPQGHVLVRSLAQFVELVEQT